MVQIIVQWIVIVIFVAVGAIHLAGGKAIRESYKTWGYPEGFHLVTGILEVAAAGLMIFASTRYYGLKLGAAITIAAVITLLWHRQFSHLVAPLILGGALAYLFMA
jgi:hypothetical protein